MDFIHKNVCFYKFDAFSVDFYLDFEVFAEVVQEFISIDIGIQGISDASEDDEASKEVYENGVHDGVSAERFQDIEVAFSQNSKELHDEALGLIVIEDAGVVVLVKDEVELWIINNVLEFADVHVVVHVLQLKT